MRMFRVLASVCLVLTLVLIDSLGLRGQTPAPSSPQKMIPPSKNDRWMTEIAEQYPHYGNLKLSEVLFPGSHDAGTYELAAKFAPDLRIEGIPVLNLLNPLIPLYGGPLVYGVTIDWSQTQANEDTIYKQLKGGLRYLDLRVCPEQDNTAWVCHGLYGPSLEAVFRDIDTYLDEPGHDKDVVIVELTEAAPPFNDAVKTAIRNLVDTYLKDHIFRALAAGSDQHAETTLQTVWNSGERLIVIAPDWGITRSWGQDVLKHAWPDEWDIPTLKDRVVQNLNCRCNTRDQTPTTTPPSRFFNLQLQGTAQLQIEIPNQIERAFFGIFGPENTGSPYESLEELAAHSNPVLFETVLDRYSSNLNIVSTDFALGSGIVEALKNLTIAKLTEDAAATSTRAYLTRTHQTMNGVATIMTSWSGTHFGYTGAIESDLGSIAFESALAHFNNSLFAGGMRVTAIGDTFLNDDSLVWSNAGSFAVDLGASGANLIARPTTSADFASAFDKLFVAWIGADYSLNYSWSSDGTTFLSADRRTLSWQTVSTPALVSYRGSLYMAWTDMSLRVNVGRINADYSFTHLATLSSSAWIGSSPAITGFQDWLVLAWTGADVHIRIATLSPDGTQGSPAVKLDDTTTGSPALAVFKGSLLLTYPGQNGYQYTWSMSEPTKSGSVAFGFAQFDRVAQKVGAPNPSVHTRLLAWGDRINLAIEGIKTVSGHEVNPDEFVSEPVLVTFRCEAPVAGVYGFADPGSPNSVITADTLEVLTVDGLAQATCVDLSGYEETLSVPVKSDTTPPTITFLGSTPPEPSETGWYRENVTLRFRCEDAESGPQDALINVGLTEGSTMIGTGTCFDKAGNSAEGSAPTLYNIDTTPPTAEFNFRTAPNPLGWNNTDVIVRYIVSDGMSGVAPNGAASAEFSVMITGEGEDLRTQATISDVAGNTTTFDVFDPAGPIKIDRTPPTVVVPASFSVVTNAVPVAVSYPAVTYGDGGSGIAASGCSVPSGSPFTEGVTTVRCTALDRAENLHFETFDVTVVLNKPPVISAVTNSGPIDEGGSATVTVTASDPDLGAVLRYQFDCDGNGSSEIGPQASPTATCSFADNGSYTVNVLVTDEHAAATMASTVVTVNNVAPSAVFTHPGSVNEGVTFTLALDSVTDPSAPDAAAGFMFAFDCGDGTGYGAFSAASSRSCPMPDEGARTVRGKVRDKDGDEREYTGVVTGINVAPAVSVAAAAISVAEGQTAANSGTFSDAGVNDVVTLTASIGSITQTGTNSGSWQWTLGTIDGPAGQTVTITASDGDSGVTTTTFTLSIANVAPVVDAGSDQTVTVRQPFTLSAEFADPAGPADAPYTWSWTPLTPAVDHAGLALEPASGSSAFGAPVTYSADIAVPGTYRFRVSITDKDGASHSDEVAVVVRNQFVAFGTRSLETKPNATITGDLGAFAPASGGTLTLGVATSLSPGSAVYANSLKVGVRASVPLAFFDARDGRDRGEVAAAVTPLPDGLAAPSLTTPAGSPGTTDVWADGGTLAPGSYRRLVSRPGSGNRPSALTLTGGDYFFDAIDLAPNTELRFAGPARVFVAGKLAAAPNGTIGPVPGSGLSARDVIFFVGSMDLAPQNTIHANVYAPNGTITFGPNAKGTGAFIARDIDIGTGVELTLDSTFE